MKEPGKVRLPGVPDIIFNMFLRILRRIEMGLFCLLLAITLSSSAMFYTDEFARVRYYSRPLEFDYFDWTLDAFILKLSQISLGSPFIFNEENRSRIVADYLQLTESVINLENQLDLIYTDPYVQNVAAASLDLRTELKEYYTRQNRLAPFAESILQEQLGQTLVELGLTTGGQPIPPVLFHVTPLPNELVISPREVIQLEISVSLISDLSVSEQVALEEKVDTALDVSSLVVPVGGIGSYPTMVMRVTSLDWLVNTIAHEWIHNYLTLRPLGMNYYANPELRTMNETAASIAGNEIGSLLFERFYPDLLAASCNPHKGNLLRINTRSGETTGAVFDFRLEMYRTRLTVDALLAEGKVEAAEYYMEQRREFFWLNGFAIRKLNQAYFAFYGAYADLPGGAAGEDPVGEAVRILRSQSSSLADFINRISQMTSFEELQEAISP